MDLQKIKLVAFDFDGVFTNNLVYLLEDGREAVACNRSDGWGIKLAKEAGIKIVIISSEVNPVVSMRAKKLGIECHQACHDKVAVLESIMKTCGHSYDQVAFVGNDVNDLPCLKKVGLPVVVQDAYPEVKQVAKIVLSRCGGNGAIREFLDLLRASKK